LDRRELRYIANVAIDALDSDPECKSLFSGPFDPSDILSDLVDGKIKGSTIGFADLGTGGNIAQTVAMPQGVVIGATIEINSNLGRTQGWASQFNPFNLDPDDYRALILIHELGHYVNKTGIGSSSIVDDGGDPTLSKSTDNSIMIYQKCFKKKD
jgi:hypothetical protein